MGKRGFGDSLTMGYSKVVVEQNRRSINNKNKSVDGCVPMYFSPPAILAMAD